MPPTSEQTHSQARPGAITPPARLVLPVAPQCIARSRYAAPEQNPPAMTPAEALAWLEAMQLRDGAIDTVEIGGPGDPLATPEYTVETIRQLRRQYPACTVVVSTLGLFADLHAQTLADNGLSQITLLVDAVDPEIVKKLYAWIRPGKKTVPLAKAAELLLSEQATAIAACKRVGMAVTIRSTAYPGVNLDHLEEVARQTASLGAEMMDIVPCPAGSAGQEAPPAPDKERLRTVRALAAKHILLVAPREETRQGQAAGGGESSYPTAAMPRPSRERPNVAVVSSNGMDVDLHLGQAHKVMIYGPREDDGLPCLLKTRIMPEAGGGSSRWEKLSLTLHDCFALLTANAGEKPRTLLREQGIAVLITDGDVEGMVDVLYGGGKQSKCRNERRKHT